MAQVLKDEIRENILKAALQEFFDKGYKSAAMRNIAQQAKIPTGLIYSYYENKETLFDAVLRPVLYDWERVLTAGEEDKSGHTNNEIYGLSKAEAECILNLFDHRKEFIILIDKSDGTKYENEKERFIKDIEEHLNKHRNDDIDDEIISHIIANNFVDGLMQIMYHYKRKEWAVMILHKLSKMYLSGIGL
ncbi:TetR/AcrR family transcriptional regulator [[Clostridium] innocuum]|nr:TetR/AcrR family transcriptional regulator [[Clostridium] innocuum]MCR0559604.1 TetR/AcrR family transcriptional regulator [[Clostridium] innocuum]